MTRKAWIRLGGCAAAVALLGLIGCRNHMPHAFTWPAGGDIVPSHAKPPEGGYYSNWDPYSVSLEVAGGDEVNPVQTQHVFVATVKDKNGKPLPNRRVEWIISEGSVGDIVEVDESGWRASRGYKVTNKYAVSHTNNFDHVLDRGDGDPSNDISLSKGQTWCVITSPVEGTTHMTVYAPGIYDWANHKVFVRKHWYDVTWDLPPAATNPTGTTHDFVTRVTQYSDGSPLQGYIVTYTITDGPAGRFNNGGSTIQVPTDGNGEARVTLSQASPQGGTNNVQIDIDRAENTQCCKPGVHLHTGFTSKTWIPPEINITKDCQAQALAGEEFTYNINVMNPSGVDANNVRVSDNLPSGVQYVSATPAPSSGAPGLSWSLGTIEGGGSRSISVTVRGMNTGTYENCAEVTADQGLSARDCCQTVITSPALSLQKTCTQEASTCDEIQYRLVVTNSGDGVARNVVVVDQLPSGMTTSSPLTFNAGDLQPGESKEATYTARASAAGTYTNRASATGDGGLSAASECTTRVTQPSLSVDKSGPDVRYIGRPAEYRIVVTNTGDSVARNTVLTDTLPPGTSFMSATNGGSASGGSVTWQLGDIAPGDSRSVNLTVSSQQAGTVTNTASARSTCAEASDTHTMEIKGIPAILLECVDDPDPVEIGGSTTYTITVTNQGSAMDTNIRIVATVQNEAEFVSADGPVNGSASGQVVTFVPLPSLAPGARATFRVLVTGRTAGDTRFRIEMTSDNIEGNAVIETESTRFY